MGIVQCHVSFQWCILAFGKTKHFFVSIKTDDLRELVVFLRKLGFQQKNLVGGFPQLLVNWCFGALESGKSQDPRNPNHQDPNHREPDGHPFFSWLFLWDDEPIFVHVEMVGNDHFHPLSNWVEMEFQAICHIVVKIQKDAEKTAPRYLLTSYRHASRH